MQKSSERRQREVYIAEFLSDNKGAHVPTDPSVEKPTFEYVTVEDMTDEQLDWCDGAIELIWGDDL
jgi:hypothetical protein